MSREPSRDQAAITEVVDTVFAAFVSGPLLDERMSALEQLFLPGAVIVRTCGAEPVAYDVDGFLRPRRELLGSGELSEFSEQATSGRIDVFGDVAHWWGGYTKSWTESGAERGGRGMKSFQLVRVDGRWRISALAWDDERDGLSLPTS
jgi:hypothetical protein